MTSAKPAPVSEVRFDSGIAGIAGESRHGIDAVAGLSIYLVLLIAIPSSLTIAALGSAGRPAALWALGMGAWWCWRQIQRQTPSDLGAQPVRAAIFLLLGIAFASYAWAMLRGLPQEEVSSADSGLLRLLGLSAVLLVASDGIDSLAHLRTVLRRIALAGGLMAALGLLQFIAGQSLLDWISIPGLSSDAASAAVDSRAGFTRASGTAMHPLEYAVVLCMAFPIALTLALEDSTRFRIARWFPVLTIAVASTLAVSRSALIGLIAGLLVLVPAWPRRVRLLSAIAGVGLVVAVGLFVPGMLGTIRGLFGGGLSDPSAASRIDSYDAAVEFVSRFPIVGKGFGTFLPRYHIVDNEYVLLTIELGMVGLLAFLGLLVAAAWSAAHARRHAVMAADRQLSQALIASLVAGGTLMAFFDGFTFPMSAGMLFLVVGISGSQQRLVGQPAQSMETL
jgi:O-antigen ligase